MSGSTPGRRKISLLLSIPMRGYEASQENFCIVWFYPLSIPMRGYEPAGTATKSRFFRLSIPMRGYEGEKFTPAIDIFAVIYPHEGL